MTIKKDITVTLTEKDKEILLTMHEWVSNLDCTNLRCDLCPFQSFCDTCHPHNAPESVLANIEEALVDAFIG